MPDTRRSPTALVVLVGALIAIAAVATVGGVWLLGRPTASTAAVDRVVPPTGDGPEDGGMLVVSLPIDPVQINPVIAPYAIGGWISDLVQPPLARRVVTDEGLGFEPALAESWSWSDDQLTLTYRLRGDVSWEGGAPLTASDVAFTYDLIQDPEVASNWSSEAKAIARVEVVDARTVAFHFTEARNPVLQQAATVRGIVPKHVLASVERGALRTHASGQSPAASGPFRVASWRPNDRIVLEPNPFAPRDWRPHLDRIVLRIQPQANTRQLSLLSGDADMDPAVEPQHLSAYEQSDALRVVTRPAAGMLYVGFNQLLPKWQDPRVRRAFAHATNLDTLIERLYTRDGTVLARRSVGTVGPNLGPWHNDAIEPIPHDLERAAALLDEAGWIDSNGNGVRDKDGEKLRFHIMYQTGSSIEEDLLVLLQDQWSKLGVEVELEPLDPGAFAARARDKRYDALLWGFGNNPKVDPTNIWGTDGPYNWFAYSNPEADRLLEEARRSTDTEVAQARIRELQQVVYNDQPAVFLLWYDQALVVHARFRDTEHGPFNQLQHAERWWVPRRERKYVE